MPANAQGASLAFVGVRRLRGKQMAHGGLPSFVVIILILSNLVLPVNNRGPASEWRHLQRDRNAARDLVLDGKNIVEAALEAIGPEVPAIIAVDELHVDPDPPAGDAHA